MPLLSRLALVGLLGAATAQAAVFETVNFDTFGGNPALTIPDWDVFGISDVRTVTSSISNLAKVEVGLTLSGGFNGDLYVYLRHGDGFSVLLNRPGHRCSYEWAQRRA
jgi:subtilisin-like proprotein convertase family protein